MSTTATKPPRSTKPPKSISIEQRLHRVEELAEHSSAMRKIKELFPDALTVSDSTQDKILLVTQEDVSRGHRGDPSACAVAQCAMRQGLGGMIGRKFAFLIHGSEVTRYQLGKDAQVRTAVFDNRGTMTPGPVLLGAPPTSARLGRISHRVKIHVGAKKKNKPVKNKWARSVQKRSEAARQVIVTHGFRSWETAGAMTAGR